MTVCTLEMWTFSPSAGITPDTDTITPPVSERLFQKQTSALPPEGIQLSLYVFAQWHNPAVYPFSSIHGFPSYPRLRVETPMSNLESPITLGGSWCTRTEPIERPQFWYCSNMPRFLYVFLISTAPKQMWGRLRRKSHFCSLNSVLANKHIQ